MEEDKNIENFFKKRLESNQFVYQESDWEDLEKRLDAVGIVPPGPSVNGLTPVKLIAGGLLITSMAFLAGWFLREGTLNVRLLANEGVEASANSVQLPVTPVVSTEEETVQTGTGRESERIPEAITAPHNLQPQIPEYTSVDEKAVMHRADDKPFGALEERRVNRQSIVPPEPFRAAVLPVDGARKAEIVPLYTKEVTSDRVGKSRFSERWSIGFSIAPDLNSVGFMSKRSFSPKIGGQLYYRFADRWMVTAGLFYNQKKYETDAEGYSPPDGYWYSRTNGEAPDNIIGSCGVLDVPVRFSYRFTGNSRLNFYGAAGVSSYILTDEYYAFEYDDPNPGAATEWSTDENSKALGGVMNFSIPVEMRISRRVYFMIEPYLQVPLTSLGWGAVDLFSTGSLFTLRFIPFRATPVKGLRGK